MDWRQKFLDFEYYLRLFKPRNCILIEADLRQFNGQKSRIGVWETLCNPVRECDSVGDFRLASVLFKSKRGEIFAILIHAEQ